MSRRPTLGWQVSSTPTSTGVTAVPQPSPAPHAWTTADGVFVVAILVVVVVAAALVGRRGGGGASGGTTRLHSHVDRRPDAPLNFTGRGEPAVEQQLDTTSASGTWGPAEWAGWHQDRANGARRTTPAWRVWVGTSVVIGAVVAWFVFVVH